METDGDGNMIHGFTPQGYRFIASYDAENCLKTHEYNDADGKLCKTEYIYSANSLLVSFKKFRDNVLVSEIRIVRDGFLAIQDRDGSNAVLKEYAWGKNMGGGIGGLLNIRSGGSDYGLIYDGRGNVVKVRDRSGNAVASYRYDAFGKLVAQSGSFAQDFMFSTKRYDADTGLAYFGYRYYAPIIGKWITRDPIEEAGGINLYGFVLNDPVNNIDPYGENSIAIGGPVGAAIGVGIGAIAGYMIYDWLTDDDDYWPDEGVASSCPPAYQAEHRKNKRKSNKNKHQKGQKRKNQKNSDKKRNHPNWRPFN